VRDGCLTLRIDRGNYTPNLDCHATLAMTGFVTPLFMSRLKNIFTFSKKTLDTKTYSDIVDHNTMRVGLDVVVERRVHA